MDPSNVFKDAVDGLTASNGSKVIPWGCLALIWYPIFSWQLPTRVQAVYSQKMMDPSNVFKDAVDGLFHSAMVNQNGWNDIPWYCLALKWHPILSWQLLTHAHAVYPDRWWILQMYSMMQWPGYSRVLWRLWNDIAWHCCAWIWLHNFSWQFPTWAQTV